MNFMKKIKTWLPVFIVIVAIFFGACVKTYNSTRGGVSNFQGGYNNPVVGNTDSLTENPFIKTADSATSTFSIDADGGSYALARRLINSGPTNLSSYKDGIRTEEFINYFTYNYPDATNAEDMAVNGEVSECPWQSGNKLIRIGIKGKSVSVNNYPFANFVLLIDVSGSMSSSDKLELLKAGFIKFAEQMRPQDRIAIVTYAGNERVALESTPGTQKSTIITAIQNLGSGGSTNGAAGIKKAYEIAQNNFIPGGNNRIILGTDGDFNVGLTSTDQLVALIEEKRNSGVYFTTLGVGLGNYNELMMEKLANKGNGNYEYLDTKEELAKVFIDEYNKFITVAKDVKIQVTFNKDIVEEYRLIGYENRVLHTNDFTNDSKDAGEIGAGQTITAIFEIKPKPNPNFRDYPSFTIHFRYKKPTEDISRPIDLDVYDFGTSFDAASENMRFAASLASLGMYIRNSSNKGNVTIQKIRSWSSAAISFDPFGYRSKHISLLQKIN
jgi:Ca-activated chloride channel homolog